MRILQIMTSKANGGAETYACDVITTLHEAGIDQCVVMHEEASLFAELKALGIRMAPAPLRVPFAPAQRFMIRGLMAREKPGIVQTWMRRAASLVSKAPVPVIGWFGGYYDPSHFRSCERLVGVTREIVAHMVKKGVPADRAHYIPTFPVITPLPPLNRATLNTPSGAKVLLTLSRLHEKKGLDTFLHALKDLPGAWLGSRVTGRCRPSWRSWRQIWGLLSGFAFLDGAQTGPRFCGPQTSASCRQGMSLLAP